MNTLKLSAATLAFFATGHAGIAATPTLYERLAATTALECRFTSVAAATWDAAGAPKVEVQQKELNLTFANINVDEGTADANSQFGDFYVAVRYANGYLHLMQAFSSGPLYTTSVMARETTGGRMIALHTRHEYTPASVPGFTSMPEMYVGDCAVTN